MNPATPNSSTNNNNNNNNNNSPSPAPEPSAPIPMTISSPPQQATPRRSPNSSFSVFLLPYFERLAVQAPQPPDLPILCPVCLIFHPPAPPYCIHYDLALQTALWSFCEYSNRLYHVPTDYVVREKIIQVVKSLCTLLPAKELLFPIAVCNCHEVLRLSRNEDPVMIHLELPFLLLRVEEYDSVVSFVRFWARKTSHLMPGLAVDPEEFASLPKGSKTYPVDLNCYQDALSEGFPNETVPIPHLAALCVVKAKILASAKQERADASVNEPRESNTTSPVTAASSSDDFHSMDIHQQHSERVQVSQLERYLRIIRDRNPIVEHAIRHASLQGGSTAAHEEAQGIWYEIGDILIQIRDVFQGSAASLA